jgi:hypothetical protein
VRELWVWEQPVGVWAVVGTVTPGGLLGFDITWTNYSERKPAAGDSAGGTAEEEDMMDPEFQKQWSRLVTLLGEIETERLVLIARDLFPGLRDDPAQRAALRTRLRFAAQCLRQTGSVDIENIDDVLEAMRIAVGGDRDAVEQAIDDAEAAVDLQKADAAEALAAAFEERLH